MTLYFLPMKQYCGHILLQILQTQSPVRLCALTRSRHAMTIANCESLDLMMFLHHYGLGLINFLQKVVIESE